MEMEGREERRGRTTSVFRRLNGGKKRSLYVCAWVSSL